MLVAPQGKLSGRVTLAKACAVALMLAVSVRAQLVSISETFTGTTISPEWVVGGTGYTPNLTAAAGIDPTGSGWLRLTSAANNEKTFAYDSTAFNGANATVAVKFNYASYGGNGADGITFFLADASKTFAVGAYGGSLGYANMNMNGTLTNGMEGGYIGLGLDEYGNYASVNEGKNGGYGTSALLNAYPNSVSIRGPGDGQSGYDYLGGTGPLGTGAFAFPTSTVRPTGDDARTFEVIITATNQLTVYMQAGATGAMSALYSIDLSGYARPDSLIMGFTGGTGGLNDIHEVQGLALTSMAARLWTNSGGTSTWANSASWDGSSGVIPAVGSDILFDNHYVSTAQTVNVGATRSVRSVMIDAPFSYTLSGGTLQFNDQGVLGPSGIFVSQGHGAAAHTINSNIIADNAIEIKNGSSGALTITGSVDTGTSAVTLSGSGTTTLSTGVVSGSGSIVKSDSGTAILTGNNTFSGGSTVKAGVLTVGNNNALGTGTVMLTGGTVSSNASNTIGNAITLQGNAGLSNITSGGTLTQSGGNRTLTLSNATQSGVVNLSNDDTARTLTVQVDSGSSTISGSIYNGGTGIANGNVTKTGAGTLALSGTNFYSGTTTVNAGTLALGASNVLSQVSSLNLAGGTFDLAGNSQKVGNLAFSNDSTIDFGAAAVANSFVFGNITTQSGVLTVKNWNSATDLLGSTVGGLNVANMYFSGYGAATEAGALSSFGSLGSAYLITPGSQNWKLWVSANTTWGTNANWVLESDNSATTFPTGVGQLASFAGTTASATATLGANRTLTGLRFEAGAKSYTMNGANTLIMDAATGGIAYVQQQSSNTQTLSFTTLQLNKNTVFDVTGSGNLAVTSLLTGSTNLVKEGTGTGKLILSGSSTAYSGNIYVEAGTLQITNNNSLGTTAAATSITTIADGATLETANTLTSAENMTLAGTGVGNGGAIRALTGTTTLSGTLKLSGDSRINADAGTLTLSTAVTSTANSNLTLGGAGNITVSGVVTTGTGGVTVDSTGTVAFSGAASNTYTGTTTVSSGTLLLNKTPAAGINAITGNLVLNGGTARLGATNQISDTSSVTINSGATFDVNGKTETIGALAGAGSLNNSVVTATTLTFGDINNTTYSGVISNSGGGALSLNKMGSGKVTLSGANTYTGTTTLTNGIIAIQNNTALGTGALTIASGGNLEVSGGLNNVLNNVTVNGPGTLANDGAIQSTAGVNTLKGVITLGSSSRIQADAGSTLNLTGNVVTAAGRDLSLGGSGTMALSGVMSGAGALIKDGDGTVTISGANTQSGAVTVSSGNLIASGGSAIGNTSAVTVASGGTLTSSANSETIGSIAGAGTVALGSGAVTLTAGGNNTSTTFSGIVSGGASASLQKAGTGTLSLTGANTLAGNVTVSAGGLTLGNASGAALGSVSNVTVGSGGTLTFGASNQINTGANLILSGGTVVTDGFSQTMRQLSQTQSSTINYLNDGSTLRFDGVTGSVSGLGTLIGTLTIDNWAGSMNGNGIEQLVIYSPSGAPTVTNVTFNGWGAATTTARADLGAGYYELIPSVTGGIQWNVDSATTQNWAVNGNWSPNTAYPNGTDAIAILGNTVVSAPLDNNVTIAMKNGAGTNTNITVGKLILENGANKNYTIAAGGGRLDFNVTTGSAQIIVNDNGSHTLAAASQVNDPILITNNSNAATGLTMSGAVTMLGAAASSITFNGPGTTSVTGVIGESGVSAGLIKTGGGSLILGAANTYTGTTTLRNGTLQVNVNAPSAAAGAFGNAATAIIVNDASTTTSMDTSLLIGNAGVTVARTVTVGSQGGTTTLGGSNVTGTATFSGAITLNKAVSLTAATGGTTTFSGQLIAGTGTQDISKIGGGTVILSNATNSYNGATNVDAGTLRVGVAGAVPTGTAVTVASGATLDINGLTQTIGSLAGAGNVTLGSPGAATTFTSGADNSSTLFSGILSGNANAAVVKTGTGTLTFAGNNTYAGTTTVSNGTLTAQHVNALGNSGGATTTTVAAGASLALDFATTSTVANENLTLNGTGVSNSGALRNVAGATTWSGTVTLATDSMIASDAGLLTLSNTIAANGTVRNLTFDGIGSTTVTGVIGSATATNNIGTLTKNGSGTLVLTAANLYSGATAVNAGTLEVQNATALGTVGTGTTVASGATLAFSGATYTATETPLTINGVGVGSLGAIRNVSGTHTLGGAITLASDSTIGADTGSSLTTTGLISGAFGLTKTGAGTLVMNGTVNNTYTGATDVDDGTLEIRQAGQLGTVAGATNIATGGTLKLNGTGMTVAENLTLMGTGVGALGSLQNIGGSNTWSGGIVLNSDSAIGIATGTTLTVSGTVSGTSGLIKTDAGTLAMTGSANSYTGVTTIQNGTVTTTINAPQGANGAFGNSTTAIEIGDAGTAVGNNLSLLIATTTGGTAVNRSIAVNNYGATVTLGASNTSGTNSFTGDIALGKSVTITAGGGTVALTGAIGGTGGITTAGSGTITLSGDNSYAGATSVTSGITLIAVHDDALGTTAGATSVASGGTLGLQGGISIAAGEALTLNGVGVGGLGALRGVSGDNTVGGDISLSGATTVGNATAGTTLTLSGAISGTQNLTTTGSGDITFAGANNITGNLTIAGGTGAMTNLSSTGTFGSGVGTITINTGNTLVLGAANQVSGQTNLALAGGTLNVGGFTNALRQISNTAAGGTLDYLNDGSKLTFGSSVLGVDGRGTLLGTLNVANWAGSLTGNGSEQLIVYSAAGAPSVTNVNFSGWGSGAATTIALGGGYYELIPSVTAIDWKTNANGTWGTGTNWVGNNAPNAIGAIVGFRNAAPLTVNPTVDLQANAIAGVLLFDTGSNNKSYTLTTSIAGGRTLTLQTASGNAAINVNDDAAHIIGGSSATAKLTLQSNSATVITNNATQVGNNVGLTINANTILAQNSTASFTVTGTGTTKIDGTITQLAGSTALVKTGSGNLILGGANTYTGTTTVRSGTLQVNVNAPSAAAGALGNSATAVIVNDASTTSTMDTGLLIGVGGVTVARTVTVGSQGNITTLGGNNTSGTGTFSGAITLNKEVSLTAASGGTVTFSGQLAAGTGTQNITKEGAGTVILSSTANNFNGATIINGGTLQLGAAGVITDGSALTMTGANTTFNLANFNETIASLASSQSTATVSLGSGTLTTGGNNTSTQFDGTITGTGALTKNGTGTMILTGNNTYSGLTTVNAGTLVAANNNALGYSAGGTTTTVLAGATLGVQGGITVSVETLNLGAATSPGTASLANLAGNNSWTGNISLTGAVANDQVKIDSATGTTLTLSGVIGEGTNAKVLTKTGAGTLTLSGAADNTYTGATNVTAGTLVVAKNNALGASGTAATTTVSVGATLGVQGGVTVASTKSFTLNGASSPASASVQNLSGTNVLNGDITLSGIANTGVIVDAATGSALTLNGAITQATSNNFVTKTGGGTLTLSGGTHNIFAGGFNINDGTVIAAKTSGIDATGRGNVVIGDNVGSAASTVLQLNASNQIKDTSAVSIGTDGQLNLQTNSDTIGALTMSGGSVIGSGTLTLGGDLTFNGSGANTATISGNVNLGGSRTMQIGNNGVNGDADLTISGIVSGTGNLTKQGTGTLKLSATNSFVGATVISAGTIVAAATNVFNTSNQLTVASGASLSLLNTDQTIGSLTGGGTVDFGTTGKLTLSSGSATFSGLFTGTGELIIGSGATLVLGANFSATNLKITLAGGSLFLNGTNSTFGTLNITNSSILDFGVSGNSTITAANVTINSGVLLTVNNWANGADYFYATTTFTQNGGPSAVLDARGSAPENEVSFTGFGGSSNTAWTSWDHQITPVPEPSTYGMIFLATCVGFVGWRRWKKKN